MNEAAITQFLFDIVTVVLLLLWYYPLRWMASEKVHPVKTNAFLEAILSIERAVQFLCTVLIAILPFIFFFFVQHHLLPKFIVAGHIGIWIATAPMLFVTLYFEYLILNFCIVTSKEWLQKDRNTVLEDLRHRCSDSIALSEENDSLKNSQIALAKEADRAIAMLKVKVSELETTNVKLVERVNALKQEHDAKIRTSRTQSQAKKIPADRIDAKYYVRINELVLSQILLRDGLPVSKAHAKRYLTKQRPWVKTGKAGGPLYAKVANLLRKGYEFTEKPLAKTLLYRCETEEGEFYPISSKSHENKPISHLRIFAGRAKSS